MNNNLENNIYSLFKSAGCTDNKCKEVINLLSDDDLEYISGGKCEPRKELVKKMLALGLTATSAFPAISFSSTFATDNKKLELKLDTENVKKSLDHENTINLENIEKLPPDNSNKVNQKDIENSNNNKRKNNYINISNNDKNMAVKYYNRDNHWQTAKKVTIGAGALGIPLLLLWGHNKFSTISDNKVIPEKSGYKDPKTVNYFSGRLTARINEMHAIFNNQTTCENIVNLYNNKENRVFDILNKNSIDQLNVSTRITSQNNLNIFADLFYDIIFSWNSLHSSQEKFDSDILFNINEFQPISFKDFIDHTIKFELGGSSSNELKDFYKIIKNIQNIKYTKYGTFGFRESVIELKFVFHNQKTTTFGNTTENTTNDTNEHEEVTDNEFDSEWKNLLNDFKNYYSKVCTYIAPDINLNQSSSNPTINTTAVTNVLNKIDEFVKKFNEFADSKNWKGEGLTALFTKKLYKISDTVAKEKLDNCKSSYKGLIKLINLKCISDENITDKPYDFWQYLNKTCIPMIKSVKETLELYNDIYNFSDSFDEVDKYVGIPYNGRKLKDLFNKVWNCTKNLYDTGYKNDEKFKEFKALSESLNYTISNLMY